jgi:hypothetical protein
MLKLRTILDVFRDTRVALPLIVSAGRFGLAFSAAVIGFIVVEPGLISVHHLTLTL